MTATERSSKSVETYLKSLRSELRDLLDEDRDEIVEEIRTHIFDKTYGSQTPEAVAATLAALGTPQEHSHLVTGPKRWRSVRGSRVRRSTSSG